MNYAGLAQMQQCRWELATPHHRVKPGFWTHAVAMREQ